MPARPGLGKARKVPVATLLHIGHAAAALVFDTIGPAGPRRAREAPIDALQQGWCCRHHTHHEQLEVRPVAASSCPAHVTQIGPDGLRYGPARCQHPSPSPPTVAPPRDPPPAQPQATLPSDLRRQGAPPGAAPPRAKPPPRGEMQGVAAASAARAEPRDDRRRRRRGKGRGWNRRNGAGGAAQSPARGATRSREKEGKKESGWILPEWRVSRGLLDRRRPSINLHF